MTDLFLPVTNEPDSNFEIDLDGATYSLDTRWNETDEAWYLDIVGLTNEVDLKGIKLVGGTDLLKPHAVLEMGELYMVDLEERLEDPDFDGFGDRYQLFYRTKL